MAKVATADALPRPRWLAVEPAIEEQARKFKRLMPRI